MRSALADPLSPPADLAAVIWSEDQGRLREIARMPIRGGRSAPAGDWMVRAASAVVPGSPDASDFVVTFRLMRGSVPSVAVGIEIPLAHWSTENFVLVPAAVYAGNRFTSVKGKYPPSVPAEFRGPKARIVVADITRLSIGPGPSFIELLTGNMSTPAMGFVAPASGEGFLLLTDQGSRLGDHALILEESDDRRSAVIRLTAPGIRRLRSTGNARVPSNDRGANWKSGEETTVHFRLHRFPARRPQELFDRLAATRKSIAGPDLPRQVLPFSAAWEMLETRFNRDNWNESRGVYMDGLPIGGPEDVSEFGWTGGGQVTQAFLFEGAGLSRSRARRNLDTLLSSVPAASGLFYTLYDGKHWQTDAPVEGTSALLPRGQGDILFCFLKQFNLLKAQGEAIAGHWEKAVRGQADALVATWKREGQFGFAIDSMTGKVEAGGTTSGAILPAGLALSSQWFHAPEHLAVAREAAEHYAQNDLAAGYTTGGVGDALEVPDSESAHGLLQSFVTLWEVTLEERWLGYARQMGRQFASWVQSYDYRFPASSAFAMADMRSAGATWANAQNRHGAPTICTASGDSLFRLFRATGDRFYLDLIRDIAHGIPQYFSRADRPYGCGTEGKTMPASWIYERVQMSDWEAPGTPQGEVPCASADWNACAMMLTWIEIPGLYVQPDSGLVCSIDHVNAKLLRQSAGAAIVELHNPTAFHARVRVMSESSSAARTPLPLNALLKRPLVSVPAGSRVAVRAQADGSAAIVKA